MRTWATKKRVFLSFVEEDLPFVRGLRLLAANPDFDIEFYDESVRAAIESVNADYIKGVIREKITRSSATVCLIGEKTHESKWVDWELEETDRQGKTIIAMAVKGVTQAVLPKLIKQKGLTFHSWDHDHLGRLIQET